jgi:hypothetical protein
VTAPIAPVALVASGDKDRGLQHADLQWSGASGPVVVYRDGVDVAPVVAASAFTDQIGARGGGSYSYRVCEVADPSVRSNVALVGF